MCLLCSLDYIFIPLRFNGILRLLFTSDGICVLIFMNPGLMVPANAPLLNASKTTKTTGKCVLVTISDRDSQTKSLHPIFLPKSSPRRSITDKTDLNARNAQFPVLLVAWISNEENFGKEITNFSSAIYPPKMGVMTVFRVEEGLKGRDQNNSTGEKWPRKSANKSRRHRGRKNAVENSPSSLLGFAIPGPGNRWPGNSRVMKFPGRVVG